MIKARATLLQQIREFMAEHQIIEVETPYLSQASNSDPNIRNFQTVYQSPTEPSATKLYLHTSPEYPMKRLLVSGMNSIYQIARVFRDAEQSKVHNPEFTMLEWYRCGFDHLELMDELDSLLEKLGLSKASRSSYCDSFLRFSGINPHLSSDEELKEYASLHGLVMKDTDRASVLDFIFSHKVTPQLGHDKPYYIYDYPVEQSALAKIRPVEQEKYFVAERFELFIAGMEIANGYNEMNDATELRRRFEKELDFCQLHSLQFGPMDENLLHIINDLPNCAGVAVGIDRLLMTIHNKQDINQVLCFPIHQA